MSNEGINPDAGAPEVDPPADTTTEVRAAFPSRDSARCHLTLKNASSMQIWALIGLLQLHADSMYAQEMMAEQQARSRITPVAAMPMRRGNHHG